MQINKLLTDEAILLEMGHRLAARRLSMQLTQAEVAEQAGVAKRTVERVEAGESAQISSLIRLLRVLDGLGGLDGLIPEGGPRPMDLLRHQGKARKRVSRRRQGDKTGPWTWDDDA